MAERCRAAGAASCDALRCDVADGASIDFLAEEVHKRHPGGLDALMIVAGVAAEKQDILTGGTSSHQSRSLCRVLGVPPHWGLARLVLQRPCCRWAC